LTDRAIPDLVEEQPEFLHLPKKSPIFVEKKLGQTGSVGNFREPRLEVICHARRDCA
jgi:hypothetical protein